MNRLWDLALNNQGGAFKGSFQGFRFGILSIGTLEGLYFNEPLKKLVYYGIAIELYGTVQYRIWQNILAYYT